MKQVPVPKAAFDTLVTQSNQLPDAVNRLLKKGWYGAQELQAVHQALTLEQN
jgi:hypothetical protein